MCGYRQGYDKMKSKEREDAERIGVACVGTGKGLGIIGYDKMTRKDREDAEMIGVTCVGTDKGLGIIGYDKMKEREGIKNKMCCKSGEL